ALHRRNSVGVVCISRPFPGQLVSRNPGLCGGIILGFIWCHHANFILIMPEALAQKKFSCPACGAEAQWNPAKKALVWPFCGTTSPAQVELTPTGEELIVEHNLAAALRGIPDTQRGWQAKKTSVRCQSCQAISVFDPERVAQRCDFCGSSALVPYE